MVTPQNMIYSNERKEAGFLMLKRFLYYHSAELISWWKFFIL